MADEQKIKIKISAEAAIFIRPETSKEEKLLAARGLAGIRLRELPVILFHLARDPDADISAAAVLTLKELPEESILKICVCEDVHPAILGLMARMHGRARKVAEAITANPVADNRIRDLLAAGLTALPEPERDAALPPAVAGQPHEEDAPESEEEPFGEDSEEFRNKTQLAKEMSISEKIKFAMSGDKEWRMLLIKDTNKLISVAVMKNPRITEGEVLMICKSSVNTDDILREICGNKDWTKNYQIRKALVENHKTPLHHALRFLGGLTEKDLATLAKSKNVSSVIATQARRMQMNKKKEK
jgi:hypothetical protein